VIPWAHQLKAVDEVLAAISAGTRRIALYIPTGGGKTWVMEELTRRWREDRLWVGIYSNRRFLIEQLDQDFADSGIDHGIRASGEEEQHEKAVQISSIQTEHSRSKRGGALHPAQRLLVDEGHLQNNAMAKGILDAHLEAGAAYVMLTGTPLGMADTCDVLIVAANMTDLRACGAIIPAIHFAPDEPDMRSFKQISPGPLFKVKEAEKAMAPHRVFGSVWENFQKINPERKPTLLFAPGVPESLWYAERFTSKGCPWAHIDGEEIWINGEFKTAVGQQGKDNRRDLLAASREGRIIGISTRFVLREGINAPWLAHCIFACIFGGLQTYLQSGGRVLRNHVSLDCVTIQDHGGNWWRHGSLNEDRHWELAYTPDIASSIRSDGLRKTGGEPFLCPSCRRVWAGGRTCNVARGGCGFEFPRIKSRPVLTSEGILKEQVGDIFRPHRICKVPEGPKRWERMYWRSRSVKGSKTFAAAMALFAQENYWQWPDPAWPLMPVQEIHKYWLVKDVPMDQLTSVPERARPKGFDYGEETEAASHSGDGASLYPGD